MTAFEYGDLVRVPFPHVERAILTSRPAMVISRQALGPDGLLLWTAMITNAARQPWPGDVHILDAERIGLVIPSKVRTAKIYAVQRRQCDRIGRLTGRTLEEVSVALRESSGWIDNG